MAKSEGWDRKCVHTSQISDYNMYAKIPLTEVSQSAKPRFRVKGASKLQGTEWGFKKTLN